MKKRITPLVGNRAVTLSIWLLAGSLLAFLPGGLFRFAWAKIVVLLLAAGAGLFARHPGRLPRHIGLIICVGAAVLLVAAWVSSDPVAALLGRWPRYEGIVVMGLYAGMLVLGARVLGGPERERRWAVLHAALAVVSIVLATVSALESTGLRPLGGAADLRPGATLGNASDQGLIGLMIAAVLALPAIRHGRSRRLLLAGCATGVLTTVLSGSRAALLGLIVGVAATIIGLALKGRRFDRKKVLVAGGALLGIGILVLLVPGTRDRLLAGGTVSGRWLLWRQTLNIIMDHPWTGIGPSGFVDVFPGYQSQQWAIETGSDFPPDSPHMWLLQAAIVGGIPLLLLAVLLTAAVLRAGLAQIRTSDEATSMHLIGAFAAVAGYGAGLLTGFTSPGTTPLALFLCGGLIATTRPGTATLPKRLQPLLGRLRSGSLSLIAGASLIAAGLAFSLPAAAAEWPMEAGYHAAATGDSTAAERQFQTAYALRPWDSDTALLAAQSFAGPAADGNRDAATRTLEWAKISLDRTPGSVEAGLALSIGYLYTDNLPSAKNELDALIARAPFTTGLYIQRGVANFGLGHPEDSLADLKTAAAQSPTSPVPWEIMGQVYNRLGQPDNAAAANTKAEQLSQPGG